MKRLIGIFAVVSLAVIHVGCTTLKNIDPTQMALAYYAQDRTYETMRVSGAEEITFKGTNLNFTVINQLQPLSIYPRDPSTLSAMVDGLSRLGTIVGAAYVGNTLAQGASRGPSVIAQPTPIIVRPEIVTTP